LTRLEVAACLTLAMIGVYSTSFGPAMQSIADDFGVSLDHAGVLLTLLFLGSIAASALFATWLHAFEPKWFAALGLLLVAAGTAGIAVAPSWAWLLPSVVLTGLGGGLMDAGAHTIVTRVSANVTRGINRLNVCFAVGAVIGPLWSGAVLGVDSGARAVVYLGICGLMLAAAGFLALSPVVAIHVEAGHGISLRLSRLALVMGLVMFLYVGAEFGLGSWVASYADRQFEAGTFAGGVITAGYWGALMVGRLISGRLFERQVSARRVLTGSIALGMLTSAAIAAANQSFALAVVAALATGLAFGPIWPAAMSVAAGSRGANVPAAMVTIGNSGGFIFPWLQGRLLVSEGAAAGILLSSVLCAGMLALALFEGSLRREDALTR
jgi:DHA1 family inner membrane transport protein